MVSFVVSQHFAMPTKKTRVETRRPDWLDKQLVQDIEKNNLDLFEVTLEKLTQLNPSFYGAPKNPKDLPKRNKVSNKLQVSVLMLLECPLCFAFLISSAFFWLFVLFFQLQDVQTQSPQELVQGLGGGLQRNPKPENLSLPRHF